jgi:hypothetical protein
MYEHSRLLSSQLPTIVGLTLDELRQLIEFSVFPPGYGCAGWSEGQVRAWAWDLRNVASLASQVEFVLGYRREWWASADLCRCAASDHTT